MDNNKEREVCFPWWGTVFFMVITCMFTFMLTHGITKLRWEADAVRNGNARWVIKDVETGYTEWEWIPNNLPGGR
jgi:hypothetical protein